VALSRKNIGVQSGGQLLCRRCSRFGDVKGLDSGLRNIAREAKAADRNGTKPWNVGWSKISMPNMGETALLVATIGGRDPETEAGPTGPLRAALDLRPDRVLLIYLADVRTNAEATLARIRRDAPGVSAEMLEVKANDPVDTGALIQAVDGALERYLRGAQGEIALCATSGTPQFSLAATLTVMARAPTAKHFQALDPSKAAPPHLREFDPDILRRTAETDQAFRALASCRFQEADTLFQRRLQGAVPAGAVEKALRKGQRLAKALIAAGTLDAGEANRVLGKEFQGSAPELEEWYRKLAKSRKHNPDWPVEVGAVAYRQATQGLLAPALLTAATCMEVAFAVRLRKTHDLDPECLKEKDRLRLPQEARQHLRQAEGFWKLEGVENLSELLRCIDKDYRSFISQNEKQREALRDARNRLVHAGKAVQPETVSQSLEFVDELCSAFGWGRPSACPSSPEAVAHLAAALRPEAGLA
jgi:hypothetical protein